VHALLGRKVRSPQEGENVQITIVSIICRRAKRRGRQYTKRLLPPVVIPFCQICREGVLAYLRRFPDGHMDYGFGYSMMGARDPRTIRRHLSMAIAQIGKAVLILATLLSELPSYANLPQRPLGQSDRGYLEDLSDQAHRAARRAGAGGQPRIPPLVYVHLVGVFDRASPPLAPSLSSVVRAVVFHDTS
jgi:hypothetical protein